MKSYESLEEWKSEGKQRFGEDFFRWKFRCPVCGHIARVIDFKEFGAEPDDSYTNCIGRFNGKGISGMGCDKKTVPENGCDWAAYGFFGTCGRGAIVKHNGKDIEVFDFADAE